MTVGRVFGIPIRVDWSWLLVYAFFVWALGGTAGPFAGLTPVVRLVAAALTVLVLFGCVIAHETSHALTARHFGVGVREIELFVFGGVSKLESTGATPAQEATIAAAGPLASVAIAIACALTAELFAPASLAFRSLGYLAGINGALAIFNLLPSYPLDGARVLHGIVWKFTGDKLRATEIVAASSSITGLALFALAMLLFVSGAFAGGIWIAFLAWFIMQASKAETNEELYVSPLASVTCADIADPAPPPIAPNATCAEALERMTVLRRRMLPVMTAGRFLGLITLPDVGRLERDPSTVYVADAMTPRERVVSLAPRVSAFEAFERLSTSGLQQLPVLDGDDLKGIVSIDTLQRAVTFTQERRHSASPFLHADMTR